MKKTAIVFALVLSALGMADQSIYTDQLNSGWQNWSWATVNLGNASPVHSGTHSISVTETGSYQALYLEDPTDQSTAGYEALVFWVNGGATGGQKQLAVQATLDGTAQLAYSLPPLPKNAWMEVVVPLVGVSAGAVDNFDGFWIIDNSGSKQAEFFVDDVSLVSKPASVATQSIYADALANSWTNASTATVNCASTAVVHSGKYSVAVTQSKANEMFELAHANFDGSQYQTLAFWINGGPTGGQSLQVSALSSGVSQTPYSIPTLPKNTWTEVIIPLATLGVDARGDVDGFVISNRATALPATYYVDDASLSVVPVVNPLTTVSVNTSTSTPISPLIYGVNSTDWTGMGKGFGMSRQGGNRLTAYNWENNASNAGSDYEYENDDLMGATNTAGWAVSNFITAAQAGGALPLISIQMAGYVSADKNPPGDVRNTPNYLAVRFRQLLAVKPGEKYVYPPVTTDAYVYEDEFVNYIKQFASAGGPLMFCMDNEPDLWSSTHAEIHPKPVTYAELLSDTVAYATSIKRVYPAGLVFGPVSYGWEGYRSLQTAPDANGRDFLTFYLASMAAASKTANKRLLDSLDLHWYPEATGDGIRITGEGDSDGLATARIQAPRSLFDSTYVENSWITQSIGNTGIDLIPGTESIISKNYPGTKLSFSEYNYGGGNSISGAIAQADVLGIFGQYGVYAAANWGIASTEQAELAGFQAFINYDRAGSRFGNLGLAVSGTTPANNSVYAAFDSTNPKRMTLVVINKTIGTTPFTVDLTKFVVNSVKAYTVVAGHYTTPLVTSVTNLADAISFTAPPLSITTIELLSK